MSHFQTMEHDGKKIYRLAFVGGQAMYVCGREKGNEFDPINDIVRNNDSINVITGAAVSINYNQVMFIEDHFPPEERAQIKLAIETAGFKHEPAPNIILPSKRGGFR